MRGVFFGFGANPRLSDIVLVYAIVAVNRSILESHYNALYEKNDREW